MATTQMIDVKPEKENENKDDMKTKSDEEVEEEDDVYEVEKILGVSFSKVCTVA